MHPQRPAFTSSIPENTSCFRNRNATKFLHRNIICVTSLNNLQKISISHRLLINRKHFHFHLRLTNHEHPAADPVWAPKTPPNLHPHTSKRPSLPEKPCTPPLTASAIGPPNQPHPFYTSIHQRVRRSLVPFSGSRAASRRHGFPSTHAAPGTSTLHGRIEGCRCLNSTDKQ